MSRDRDGFTLLEAIAALAMVSMTGLSAMVALRTSARTTARARHALEASILAEQQLQLVDLLVPMDGHLPDSLQSGRFDAPLQDYSWIARVSRPPKTPALLELVVRVDWEGGSYEIETHRYQRSAFGETP